MPLCAASRVVIWKWYKDTVWTHALIRCSVETATRPPSMQPYIFPLHSPSVFGEFKLRSCKRDFLLFSLCYCCTFHRSFSLSGAGRSIDGYFCDDHDAWYAFLFHYITYCSALAALFDFRFTIVEKIYASYSNIHNWYPTQNEWGIEI